MSLGLEMDSAMMIPTQWNVTMMVETVVDHVSMKNIALIVHVIKMTKVSAMTFFHISLSKNAQNF